MRIRVDTSAFFEMNKVFTKIEKSAFPLAVRQTLSDAAFYTKKQTLLKVSNETFTIRQRNFFKANSRAEPAQGFDIDRMVATVGMWDQKLTKINGRHNYAVDELEQQEVGGDIDHKTFIPMTKARKGGKGVVREKFRYSDIGSAKDIIRAQKGSLTGRGRAGGHASKKQQFIRAAIMAQKMGKSVFMGNKNPSKGSRTLFFINRLSIFSNIKTRKRKLDIKVTPIYNVKKGRAIKVKKTDFMKRAALDASLQIDNFFMKNAHKQIDRLMRKV
jgi:hypothetical protein